MICVGMFVILKLLVYSRYIRASNFRVIFSCNLFVYIYLYHEMKFRLVYIMFVRKVNYFYDACVSYIWIYMKLLSANYCVDMKVLAVPLMSVTSFLSSC